MKRLVALLMTACLVGTMLVGCGQKEEATSKSDVETKEEVVEKTESEETASATAAGGNVTIWYYWETEGHQKALNHIIQEFNSSQSDVTVEAKYVPFADFKKQLSIGASADELPDLVILDNPDHASYAAMGIFADLTDRFDVSTYYPGFSD